MTNIIYKSQNIIIIKINFLLLSPSCLFIVFLNCSQSFFIISRTPGNDYADPLVVRGPPLKNLGSREFCSKITPRKKLYINTRSILYVKNTSIYY